MPNLSLSSSGSAGTGVNDRKRKAEADLPEDIEQRERLKTMMNVGKHDEEKP